MKKKVDINTLVLAPEALEILKKELPLIKRGIELLEIKKELTLVEIDKELRALRSFLDGEKKILPKDATDFLRWFIYVRHAFITPREMFENWPEIVPSDFLEFHEYKKYIFYKGGRVGDLPARDDYQILANHLVSMKTKLELQKENQPQKSRSFDQLFTNKVKVLNAAIYAKLIVKNENMVNGYEWIYDDRKAGKTRSYGFYALWESAKEANLIQDEAKRNDDATVEAFRVFFGFNTLGKGTLRTSIRDNKQYDNLYALLYSQMVKKQ